MDRPDLLLRIVDALSESSITVDTVLSAVYFENARYHITVSIQSVTNTDEERDLMRSAAHVTIQMELAELHPADMTIQVLLPLSSQTSRPLPPGPNATEWCQMQSKGVDDFVMAATDGLATAVYKRVMEVYPWRKRDLMSRSLPYLVENSRRHQTLVASLINVDDIVPGDLWTMLADDRDAVWRDATFALGRTPRSLLECYETVYRLVAEKRPVSIATTNLFYTLFAM